MIDQIIDYNKTFVAEKGYEKYITDKYPDKKLAVLSCMDTRLTELLPAALGLKNGDAKIIKNAGGLVISAFDSAFVILISGLYNVPELNGIALTQAALGSEIGSAGPVFIALAIFLFAFSSIIGNYYYGEANVRHMTSNPTILTVYRILSGGVLVIFGAMASLELVWSVGDLCMALLTVCNLIAIIALGKYVFRLLDDYVSQKRRGIKEPTFSRKQLPEIENDIDCWEDHPTPFHDS